ncbi:gliding motility-associated C-terminal domain-containing protein [Flexithrix dorotheae]|uniref:gliding motility-associated C-terminal domain-containing protein n=1 Tax=Flexithrix dorotheae TaxID=70993 RepID=UPI0012FBCD33|nr:gliding motility-associated C-terminal domain-containing protein [Flexithrix dorotheae]
MKRLLLLISFVLGLQVIANAQMADDIDDAVYICNEIMDVSMDISFFQKDDATDPNPACSDGITNSGWLKVKAVATGNITLNFLDISGTDFSIAVYNTDINGNIDFVNPPIACKVTSGGSDNVTFPAVAEDEFYILVDPEEGKTGFFRVNASGSIEKPDLSLSSSQLTDNGFLSSYEIENNSTANGDLDDFNLIVTFIPADVSCFDTEGWEQPTIISINGAATNTVVAGSEIVPNFKIGDILEIGSDFPGEWELTLEPVNQQCYAQQREKSITNITVFRLLPYRTTDNTFAEQVCGDDVYCDQNPINEWYAKAVILPETSSTPQPQITQWDWEFFTKDGTPLFSRSSTVSGEITNYDGNEQIGFTLTTTEEALLNGIDYEIKVNVAGTNGPGVYESLLEAYSANTPTLSVSNPIVCISDINAANPLLFEVTNAQTLSPKPIAGNVNWTIPTELGGGVTSGDNAEILSFLDNSLLEPCTYTLTAEMADELGCTETSTVDVTIVAQEEIAITGTTSIDPATAREQCGVTVYKAGDKVKFDFNVDKVAPCQPVNVTVTYGGAVIMATASPQVVETASYSFEITHNGTSEPVQIVAEKVDETLRVCNTAFSIPLPLFLEGGPELSIAGPICEKDISTSNPFQILLANAGDLPSPVKTTWINPPGTVLIQDDVSISLTDLPFGTYSVEAQVEYGAGCSDLVSIDFEILQQAEVENVNIVGPTGDCISPRGFQIGDELKYSYRVFDIPTGTTVTIQTPSGTTTPQAISGTEFTGEFDITVIDEPLEADGITWNAGKIIVTSENGCEQELDIEIPVVPAPLNITPLEDETICINENSITLNIGVLYSEEDPVTFAWSSNDIALPAENTNASITVDGLEENQSYVITATVSNPLCTLTRDFTVNVNTTPPALVYNVLEDPSSMQTNCNNEEGFCLEQMITIEYGSNTATEPYSILVNIEGEEEAFDFNAGDPLRKISYTVTGNPEPVTLKIWNTAGSEDCAVTETVEVPILQLVEVIGEDEGCNGSVIREIGVTPTCNASGFTFDWSISEQEQLEIIRSNPVNNVRNNKVTIDLTGQPDGIYEFKVEVSNGECSQVVPININFSNSLPDAIVSSDQDNPNGYCVDQLQGNKLVLLELQNINEDASSLRIDWGSTPAKSKELLGADADLNSESIPLNIPEGTAPGTYEFIAEVTERSSENECTTTLTYSLIIFDEGDSISITSESPEVCTFIETQLSASGGNSYTWFKVDASGSETEIGTGSTLDLFPEEAGTFTYRVKDLQNSCIEPGTFELVVTDCDLFVPNVFTPDNGDDINQTFEIPRISGRNWTLTVYNRYGDQVYKNVNYDNSWAGENLTDGMYYYHLKSKEGTKEFKGWLRLLKAGSNGDSR